MKIRRELTTEKSQINNNDISFINVYNAILSLDSKYQIALLENYKLPDMYYIIRDENEYMKHVKELSNTIQKLSDMLNAIINLRREAIKDCKASQEYDVVESTCHIFDKMSGEDKKKFCGVMLDKKEFFTETYGLMMVAFESELEAQ